METEPRLTATPPKPGRAEPRMQVPACAAATSCATLTGMDLDAMLIHYFGTSNLEEVDEGVFDAGRDRALAQLGLERDSGRRFGLWVLLHAMGSAPDPAVVFKDSAERQAAEDYARAAERIGRV